LESCAEDHAIQSPPASRIPRSFIAAGWVLIAGLTVAVLFQRATLISRPPQSWFVGEQVVPKFESFSLRSGGVAGARAHWFSLAYRVKKVEGTTLWLDSEGDRRAGSADAGDVVPLYQAVEYFTGRLRSGPKDRFAYLMRGSAWKWQSDFGKAIDDYIAAIQIDPGYADAYLGRASALAAKQENDKAIADYSEAIRLDRENPVASRYQQRANAFLDKGDYDQALADFNRAIELNPASGFAFSGRGAVWGCTSQFEGAIADYSEAPTTARRSDSMPSLLMRTTVAPWFHSLRTAREQPATSQRPSSSEAGVSRIRSTPC
jgi:hypothetical protein